MSILKDQSSGEVFQLSNLQNDNNTITELPFTYEIDNPNQKYYNRKRIDSEEIECVIAVPRNLYKRESMFDLSIESKKRRSSVLREMEISNTRPVHFINSFKVNSKTFLRKSAEKKMTFAQKQTLGLKCLRKTRKIISRAFSGNNELEIDPAPSSVIKKQEHKEDKIGENEGFKSAALDLSKIIKMGPLIFKSRKIRQKIQKLKDHWQGRNKVFPHTFRIFGSSKNQVTRFEIKDLSKKEMGQSESESVLEEENSDANSDDFCFTSLPDEKDGFELFFVKKTEPIIVMKKEQRIDEKNSV